MDRRNFIGTALKTAIAGVVPVSVVKLAFAQAQNDFSFACISDSHLQQIRGSQFVRRQDQALLRAVNEVNLMAPRPDFVVFGGDLAQLGSKAELDHGADILSRLHCPVHMVMGEHDYYLDLGAHWRELFGRQNYSFDHKGVHFIVLNSVLTCEDWTLHRWESAERRMAEMTGLDSPRMSPFMVGDMQRQWLQADLDRIERSTPIVVLSHSPLQKIRKSWNFWTDDADMLHAMLAPFEQVNVIYGHVHQLQQSRLGNIHFNSVVATAWPWPNPQTANQAGSHIPMLTVPLASPPGTSDGASWQLVNLYSGRVEVAGADVRES
ncbi:MAG: metallophosphoesterase [Pseudohongiella sp.]|uniref:metallophosphoesterase n=1 Tax=Pseudohongiella sp. TaxID=1979412 RepID=UPI0034A0907E